MSLLQNLVVVGGSYIGVSTAQQLAAAFSGRFRVLLIEKNSHFQHLFAFPRFAVTSAVDTHKAFIPYTPGVFAKCPPNSGTVIQASAIGLDKTTVHLDRKVSLDGQLTEKIPYSFLVVATGTKLTPPSSLPGLQKTEGTNFLRKHAQRLVRSSNVVLIGGGAVGVQTATDIKELYPEKAVTLIHSRNHIMNNFHPALSDLIKERCQELGINLKLGSRVKLPADGYPTDGTPFNIELEDGSKILADLAIICTGQVPQSSLIKSVSPQSIDNRGFIKTLKSLQISDSEHPSIFAVGDVADTGAHKAARPGLKQAALVTENIQHILNKEPLESYDNIDPPAIHLTLGITKNVIFRNPPSDSAEPVVKHQDDGRLDMSIDAVWERRGGGSDPYQ